jgi:hypothetical protein
LGASSPAPSAQRYEIEMNRQNKFEKRVLKPTIKEVRKYHRKNGGLPDENTLNEMKIQVLIPSIRILSATFGLFLLIISIFAMIDQDYSIGWICAIVGAFLTIVGFRGKKKKLKGVLKRSYTGRDIGMIIEAILYIDW